MDRVVVYTDMYVRCQVPKMPKTQYLLCVKVLPAEGKPITSVHTFCITQAVIGTRYA